MWKSYSLQKIHLMECVENFLYKLVHSMHLYITIKPFLLWSHRMQIIKVMMSSLLEKLLPTCIIVLIRALFTTVIVILLLASSSQFTISSSFAASSSNMGREAETLLEWKASLDNQSQFRLSSWVGNITCLWVGISCNNFSSVSHVNLIGFALKGTLYSFSFSSLHCCTA